MILLISHDLEGPNLSLQLASLCYLRIGAARALILKENINDFASNTEMLVSVLHNLQTRKYREKSKCFLQKNKYDKQN